MHFDFSEIPQGQLSHPHNTHLVGAAIRNAKQLLASTGGLTLISKVSQVVEELGSRIDAADAQVLACTRTGDVEQVSFGIVDLFQIRFLKFVGLEF